MVLADATIWHFLSVPALLLVNMGPNNTSLLQPESKSICFKSLVTTLGLGRLRFSVSEANPSWVLPHSTTKKVLEFLFVYLHGAHSTMFQRSRGSSPALVRHLSLWILECSTQAARKA